LIHILALGDELNAREEFRALGDFVEVFHLLVADGGKVNFERY
jgi:hypothetical protein